MSNFSLVANTGIQFIRVPNIEIDLDGQAPKRLNFFEIEIDNEIELDPVYFFPINDKFVKRRELISSGFLDPYTNEIEDENKINFDLLTTYEREQILSINNIDTSIRRTHKDQEPLTALFDKWLPMPFLEEDNINGVETPNNWCRIKLIPKNINRNKINIDVLFAFDTTIGDFEDIEKPNFTNNERLKKFSLCGYSFDKIFLNDEKTQNKINNIIVPNVIYEYCSKNNNWINANILKLIHGDNFDLSSLEKGTRMKYYAFYMYLIYYLHQSKLLPSISLYSDENVESIDVNLVVDIGNSRTYGILAEDPIDPSFSKSEILSLTDLSSGDIYAEPFDMRLAFRKEEFGSFNPLETKQFIWPSILSIGKEAQKYIYHDTGSVFNGSDANTHYSSPKRYLWDTEPFKGQWEFAQLDNVENNQRTIWMEGVSQQFRSDGSFAENPRELGALSSYSRKSLMTFSFIEIILQARLQANSYKFRKDHGDEGKKRKISRIIITSPTAMPKEEQIALRQCADEANVVLSRFYKKEYDIPVDFKTYERTCEIIPRVKDLSQTSSESEEKRNWGYDEASCCQMVYLYSEMKRFLGKSNDLFDLYGHKRTDINLESSLNNKSLTIGSIDVGAGTTDIMICNYSSVPKGDATIVPFPLFWDSFRFSGDDLVKALIIQLIIEDYGKNNKIGVTGMISNKLKENSVSNYSNLVHNFFDDTSSMTFQDRKMRRDFNVQISIPIVYKMLDLLQKDEIEKVLVFDDFFKENKPQNVLLDFFEKHFGFRFESLNWKFSPETLNTIIQKVFEPNLRKWTAILSVYGCDIVLLGGRPTSLQKVQDIILKLYPVAPNRLISMNNYRVGNWYPGTDGVGYFGDRKSLVAVGALISYLSENGKLNNFKLNTKYLKTKVQPTSDYIGYINHQTGEITDVFLEPSLNKAKIRIDTFPYFLGTKQLKVNGYPSRILYVLDFNDKKFKETILQKTPDLSPNELNDQLEVYKNRIKSKMPLNLTIIRSYKEDKEKLEIDSITNNDREDVSPSFIILKPQSLIEDVSDWLNTGKFILTIGK